MIEFRNVSKVYNNGTEALHNINLKVEKGEFVFIVGSSGAGKSTFLKLITCEERPNEGQVLIDGQDISHIRKGKIVCAQKMGLCSRIPSHRPHDRVRQCGVCHARCWRLPEGH